METCIPYVPGVGDGAVAERFGGGRPQNNAGVVCFLTFCYPQKKTKLNLGIHDILALKWCFWSVRPGGPKPFYFKKVRSGSHSHKFSISTPTSNLFFCQAKDPQKMRTYYYLCTFGRETKLVLQHLPTFPRIFILDNHVG